MNKVYIAYKAHKGCTHCADFQHIGVFMGKLEAHKFCKDDLRNEIMGKNLSITRIKTMIKNNYYVEGVLVR